MKSARFVCCAHASIKIGQRRVGTLARKLQCVRSDQWVSLIAFTRNHDDDWDCWRKGIFESKIGRGIKTLEGCKSIQGILNQWTEKGRRWANNPRIKIVFYMSSTFFSFVQFRTTSSNWRTKEPNLICWLELISKVTRRWQVTLTLNVESQRNILKTLSAKLPEEENRNRTKTGPKDQTAKYVWF